MGYRRSCGAQGIALLARFGPTTPTRAGRLADASVDPTEARNRRALTTPNVAISRCLEADERADRPATPEQV
jgi:hypothetical protein